MVIYNFAVYQGNNESRADVLDIFGVLESLRRGNISDTEFIKLWFTLKMAPALPYINEDFLILMSNQNFSCNSFQEL